MLSKIFPVLSAVGALTAVSILGTPSATAALLLDPTGGTVLISPSTGDTDKDDGVALGSHKLTGNFFGYSQNNITPVISVNGLIHFGSGDGNGDWFVEGLGSVGNRSRIAPMWQNFNLGTNGKIVESIGNAYYAVSWLNMEVAGYTGYANFQAILFDGAATINGNDFLAGDIVFSYGDISIYSTINEVVIGLEDFSDNATLPGVEAYDGFYSYAGMGEFPVGANQYLLFRADGFGYDSSIVTAIPEPSTYALLATSGLVLAGRLLQRRRR